MDFKGHFFHILWTLKCKLHAQYENLKGEFEVLVHEYSQNVGFREPCSKLEQKGLSCLKSALLLCFFLLQLVVAVIKKLSVN